MRVYKSVYCNSNYMREVDAELQALYSRLKSQHPDWEFDVDLPGAADWEVADD